MKCVQAKSLKFCLFIEVLLELVGRFIANISGKSFDGRDPIVDKSPVEVVRCREAKPKRSSTVYAEASLYRAAGLQVGGSCNIEGEAEVAATAIPDESKVVEKEPKMRYRQDLEKKDWFASACH